MDMKWKSVHRLSGNYTVEAAFVTCISVLSIFSLIFLFFFLHDIQILKSEMERTALRAAMEKWDSERVREEAKQLNMEAMFFMEVEEWDWEIDSTKILKAKISFPIPEYVALYFAGTNRKGWLESRVEEYVPQEFVRGVEAVKAAAEE